MNLSLYLSFYLINKFVDCHQKVVSILYIFKCYFQTYRLMKAFAFALFLSSSQFIVIVQQLQGKVTEQCRNKSSFQKRRVFFKYLMHSSYHNLLCPANLVMKNGCILNLKCEFQSFQLLLLLLHFIYFSLLLQTKCHTDLSLYPFDQQFCRLSVESYKLYCTFSNSTFKLKI